MKQVFQCYIILLTTLFYMGIVGTLWVCIAENARWKTGVLSEDLEAILLYTALYLHPKSSHTVHIQYKRVQAWFSTLYYTFRKCNHGNSAYSVGLYAEYDPWKKGRK